MRSKTIGMAVLAVCVGALFAPSVGLTQEADRTNTITVGADRQIDVEPDLVRTSFGVRTNGRSAGPTLDKLSKKTNAVLAALRAEGYSDDELETRGVSLQRDCLKRCSKRDGDRRDPVLGYRASADVIVETTRIEDVGTTIDAAVDAGANRINRVVFDVQDRSEAVKEALRQAMGFATEKAQVIAEAGGRSLGPALIITEGRTRAPQPDTALGSISGAGGRSSDAPPIEVEPPTLSASARVTVTFELR